jgi:DNA-binding transcriptional MerR regulator
MYGDLEMMNIVPASESLANATELSDGYIRIGDMAKQFGVTLRTLRFYEDKGLLNPKREGNQRLYTQRDITRLKLITLGTKVGFSLREVKHVMDMYDPNGSNLKQLRVLVDKSERQLVKLEKQRAELDEAIDDLKDGMLNWRAALAERQAA